MVTWCKLKSIIVKKMTFRLLFGLLLMNLVSNVAAQKNLYITYNNIDNSNLIVVDSKIELTANDHSCLSTTNSKQKIRNWRNPDVTEIRTLTTNVYKDLRGSKLYCNDIDFTIKEDLNLFDWKLGGNKKEILGYTCNDAKCHFRGRDYVAWFTVDLPFKAAPWKFHGLPGVILQVYTTDKFVDMEAISVAVKEGPAIKNPYKGKKTNSYQEFEKSYIKSNHSAREKSKVFSIKHNQKYKPTPLPRIEIIIEENTITWDLKKK
jgi:GLPGLI family protein